MTAAVKGRSTMALYSSDHSIHCHRVRFVLAEKGINVDIIDVTDDESAAADLAELNPYNETPTLVDRDLLLHNAGVINDYLDERYPHPPLMPVDPVSRARLRLIHHRVIRDWYPLAEEIENTGGTAILPGEVDLLGLGIQCENWDPSKCATTGVNTCYRVTTQCNNI